MKKQLLPVIILILALISCSKENIEISVKKDSVTGFVQKGLFINGTSININEPNAYLSQTEKFFNTQIADNQGRFEIENIELISNYITEQFLFNYFFLLIQRVPEHIS